MCRCKSMQRLSVMRCCEARPRLCIYASAERWALGPPAVPGRCSRLEEWRMTGKRVTGDCRAIVMPDSKLRFVRGRAQARRGRRRSSSRDATKQCYTRPGSRKNDLKCDKSLNLFRILTPLQLMLSRGDHSAQRGSVYRHPPRPGAGPECAVASHRNTALVQTKVKLRGHRCSPGVRRAPLAL